MSVVRRAAALVLLTVLGAGTHAIRAQTPAEHVALGDRARETSGAEAALRHYEAAVAADPQRYEASWKASLAAVDVGEGLGDVARRRAMFAAGERHARHAVELNAADAEGHFALARALGRTALSLGTRDRVKYAAEVRAQALEALKANPRHAGALHVMGAWNAEVMRLNGMSRFMARNFLGGQVFGTASWKEAQRYMEQAVAIEPERLVHRVDLAEIYADVGDNAKAREHAEFVVQAPATEANDAKYKKDAEALLKRIQ